MENTKIKAILVDVIDHSVTHEEAEKRLEELESLVNTFGGIAVSKTIQQRTIPDYETYIGSGKVAEIKEICIYEDIDVVVVNNLLKPRQIFKLQEILRKGSDGGSKKKEVKVWDRVDLILKIFSKHAKSTEAKLQIELASIKHMGPRIYGMGIELSRQAGAMGVRAGQGETNIELMKRHLRKQELSLLKKLKHYEDINLGHRERRRRHNFKTAALVGYTNAGKSSLLNALTGKKVYIADELFATLSTRVGKLYISPKQIPENEKAKTSGYEYQAGREVLISDTIGFIQDLPPELIKAFKSTLAETIEADLILHVIDVTDPQVDKKIEVVEDILDQLGVADKPKIYIFNKIDLINYEELSKTEETEQESLEYLLPALEAEEPPEPHRGMVKAGKDAAVVIGWVSKEEKAKQQEELAKKKKLNPSTLKNRYKKFTPVFVSAFKKENLEALVSEIEEKI